MSFGPKILSFRAWESSLHPCSVRQCVKSARFPGTCSSNSASCEHSAGTGLQSSAWVLPRRQAARNLMSRASFSNVGTGGKDLPTGSSFNPLCRDHNLWASSRHRVGGDKACRCVDHQPASTAGISDAMALLGQARRSSPSILLTAEDRLRQTSNNERAGSEISSEKMVVLPKTATNASKQLCVAVDVDEVLGSFLANLNVFIEETYFLHHELSEYHIYDFMKIWNCSQAEANYRVHAFFESDHFKKGISPIPGAHQTLLQLGAYCELVVVTSRQHIIKEATLQWIERYYGGIFTEVHFGNHFALEGSAKPKSEICRSLGVHVLIDDNPRYALDCAECGIEVLLFDLHGGYPWSKTPCGPQHPLITRVKDWQEVEQALIARTCASL